MAGEKRPTGRARTAKKASAIRAPKPASPPENAPGGSVGAAVRTFVDGLELTEDPKRSALAEVALALAAQLDGDAGMATAAVSKELRATLQELDGDGEPDDDPFSEWEDQLGTPA